jgi:hypothetical protein
MLPQNIRLKPFDFLVDAASVHYEETGVPARSFIVPEQTLDELKLDPRTGKGGFEWQAYVGDKMVVGSNRHEPMIVDEFVGRTPLI